MSVCCRVRMDANGGHDLLALRLLHAGPMRSNVSNNGQLAQESKTTSSTSFVADPPPHDWDSKDCVARPLQFFFEQAA